MYDQTGVGYKICASVVSPPAGMLVVSIMLCLRADCIAHDEQYE